MRRSPVRYGHSAVGSRFAGILAIAFGVLALAAGPNALAINADDFDRANLDPTRWTFVSPLGDGSVAMTGYGTNDAYLELTVPEGQSHDPWQALNRSVRVMQPAADADFDIFVKFSSEPDPAEQFQLHGIIVEESAETWIRYNLQSNDGQLRLFGSTTRNGFSSFRLDVDVDPGEATYLRINRTGDTWTCYYSTDGVMWTMAGSFDEELVVTSIGPFVANHSSGDVSPAYTAKVDSFELTATPLGASEDDGTAEPDTWAPFIHTISTQASGTSLTVNWYTDELAIGAADLGMTTSYGMTETETIPAYFHSVTFDGLTPGQTYNYHIRSSEDPVVNSEAVSDNFALTFDPAGPIIDVWYGDTQNFGQVGNPQEFYINILGNVSDLDGVASLSYTIDGGSPVSLSIGPDGRRLVNTGDFNVDLDWTTLSDGAHTLVITATDNAANVTTKTVMVNYTAGNVWPKSYTANWSGLATDGDPATPDPAIQSVAQVVDGKWSVDNGVIRTVEPGYDRLIGLGDHLSDDYEVLVPVTIHSTPNYFGVGMLFRWNGHTDSPVICTQPKCGYFPLGVLGYITSDGVEFWETGVYQSLNITTGVTYWLRMRVESSGPNPVYYLKTWVDGETEPTAWNLEHTDFSVDAPQTGSLLLISHRADADFGTVEIIDVDGAPNLAPVATGDNDSVLAGGSAVINVLGNDSDMDGSLAPATVTITSGPSNGMIEAIDPTTGAITYMHNGSATSSDSFEYTVKDNVGAVSNTATVIIEVLQDTDGDGVLDSIDNCALADNPSQCDSDGDGFGNHCDGDLDNSGGIANFTDLAFFGDQFGEPSVAPDYNAADFDCSGGIVNFTDLGRFRELFGMPPGPSGVVP